MKNSNKKIFLQGDVPQYSFNSSNVALVKPTTRDSPKRGFSNRQQKTKPMSPDEWLRKLEAENWSPNDDDEEEEISNNLYINGDNKKKKKKKREINDLQGIIFFINKKKM